MIDYNKQAIDFITSTGITITRTFTGTRPAPWSQRGESVDTYIITITRKDKSFSFDYHDSIHNTEIRKLSPWDIEKYNRKNSFQRITRAELIKEKAELKNGPTDYSILSTLSAESYQYDTFEYFCDSFGYDTDSRKALETYLACQEMSSKINRFFTSPELEQLREIQ